MKLVYGVAMAEEASVEKTNTLFVACSSQCGGSEITLNDNNILGSAEMINV